MKVLGGKLPACKVNCKPLGLLFRKEDIASSPPLRLLGKDVAKLDAEDDDNPLPDSTIPGDDMAC